MSRLARYAWWVLAFNVGVILLGATVRATGSGAGCGRSWPTCQGVAIPQLQGATTIEFTHRVFSGLALVLVVGLGVLVWRRVPKGEPARLGALLSVIALFLEAAIGAMIVLYEWVSEDASLARTLAVPMHLVNTLFLLASLTLTAFWLSGGRRLDLRSHPGVRRWVTLGGLALIVLAASGAVTALADTLFPKDAPGFLEPASSEHILTDLRILHPILALLAVSIGWVVAGRGEGPRTMAGRSLLILVGLMLVTGPLNIVLGTPLWMQLLHLGLADTLWIAYVLTSAQALQARIPVPQSG